MLAAILLALTVAIASADAQHSGALSADVQGRFNAYGLYGEETPEGVSHESGIGIDLYGLFVTGTHTALEFGLSYATRGLHRSSESDREISVEFRYMDMPLMFHWYFTGLEPAEGTKPYLFVGVVPGIFLNGVSDVRQGSREKSYEVEHDEVATFHLAARIGLGLDVPVSENITVGFGAGYEHGLFTPVPEEEQDDDYTVLFNTIMTKVTMRLWL